MKELHDKYPPLGAENGVAYKQKLDYLTFETDFLEDTSLRTLRNQYGNDVIAIIFYLRTRMCSNGWKIRIDNDSYQCLVDDCGYNCNINIERVHTIIQDLIKKKLFFVVEDNSVEEGIWLTCPQQIYNYEMACNNRQQSRKRKSKSRTHEQNSNHQETQPPYTGQQFNENAPSNDSYPYGYSNYDPFDIFNQNN